MDEDHSVAFGGDELRDAQLLRHLRDAGDFFATIAVLPMVQRTTQTIADNGSSREIDSLMRAMRRQRAHDTVVAASKKHDRNFAEVEAEDLSASERVRRRDHRPPRNEIGWMRRGPTVRRRGRRRSTKATHCASVRPASIIVCAMKL